MLISDDLLIFKCAVHLSDYSERFAGSVLFLEPIQLEASQSAIIKRTYMDFEFGFIGTSICMHCCWVVLIRITQRNTRTIQSYSFFCGKWETTNNYKPFQYGAVDLFEVFPVIEYHLLILSNLFFGMLFAIPIDPRA